MTLRHASSTSAAAAQGERSKVRFAGYAAVFDRVDRGGDIVRPGAFGTVAGPVPLLWQHQGAAVGTIERIEEDARGLRVIASVDAPGLAAQVAAGGVKGLSFGYRVKAARHGSPAQGQVRELLALDLIEVSLVTAPMQPLARVLAVEAA
jgi:HK97 family phage prohead protease